jgi:PAS domain S-box-containing protein
MKANYRIAALLIGAVMVVALGMTILFSAFNQIEDSAQKRTHTSLVLKRTNELLAAMIDAETGTRGYLLTGDEVFLEPYLTVKDGIGGQMEELRQLIRIDAANKHLDVLAPLMDARLAHLSRTIELYRSNDAAAAIATVRSGEGKRLMDAIRVEINSINKIEEDQYARQEAEFQASMRFLLIVISVASLLVLILALSFAYLVYRETQRNLNNFIHQETKKFLEIQTETNKQLVQINANLRVSEENLAVTLNSIGDAVIATDAEGLVTLLNPLAEQLTGWTRENAVGHLVDEVFRIINEETRHPATVPVMDTLKNGTLLGLANHTILIALNGSECSIADSCAPIRDHNGQVMGAVLVFRDVTERNHLDRSLREKNVELESARLVAEKASDAKSDFLSSMSHELRSPLNAILGLAQLMESDSPPPTASQKQSIDQISQAGWHLLKLIDEVLDLSKVESGQLTISPEPVSLVEVMRECQSMIESQAYQRRIRTIFPQFNVPCYVRADRTRVKQILINLLSNAIKYNRQEGTVEVKCTENVPGRIRISIRDTGAGLAPEQVAQLFQAFNRLGQEAGGVEGTGIGLVVAKRLVELMGGEIGVESTVGQGSMFWFELILASEPRLPLDLSNTVMHIPRSAQLQTLLYVEDNPANLKLVEQIIARHPEINLLTAINGNSGIEIARASRPDVILMDINLPDISGIEALKILSMDPVTAHIPIVALSANAMPRDIKKGLEAGFFRYITKPIKINEFMVALSEALEFSRMKSAVIE